MMFSSVSRCCGCVVGLECGRDRSLGHTSDALPNIFRSHIKAPGREALGARLPCDILKNLASGVFSHIKAAGRCIARPVFSSFAGLADKVVLKAAARKGACNQTSQEQAHTRDEKRVLLDGLEYRFAGTV
jgi:hypothetical protein